METPPVPTLELRIADELVRWATSEEKKEAREVLMQLYADPLLSIRQSIAARSLAVDTRSVFYGDLIDGMWRQFHTLLLAKARQHSN